MAEESHRGREANSALMVEVDTWPNTKNYIRFSKRGNVNMARCQLSRRDGAPSTASRGRGITPD